MKGTVHHEIREAIAWLTVDNPPVNPLSSGVRKGLLEGVEAALSDSSVKAIILTGEGRTFISGADIAEFGKATEGPGLHECLTLLESSTKPIIAAINGAALGGGLEVALCCDFRIAVPSAQIGFPEVRLGLLPGAGGTQRLPRLIGARKALDLMLSGTSITARRAARLGIIDKVADKDLHQAAIEMALVKAETGELSKIRNEDVPRDRPGEDFSEVFAAARRQSAQRMRGQFAPEMIIQCVEAAVNYGDFDAALKLEGELFAKCLAHPQRKAMIHVFFAERQVAKIPDIPRDIPVREINQAGIVGCGTMGGGIAMCFANVGIPVSVVEKDEKALDRGLAVIRKNYQYQVDRKRISEERMNERMALITGATDYRKLAGADLIIEAIYENLDVKVEIFRQLDAIAAPGALIMSNTSGLDVDRMAAATSDPSRVAGMHFFSPANVMRLLEVVRGAQSSAETIATAMKVGRKLGKVSVLAGNCPGFIGNRMLAGYTRQAGEMILQGASPYEIDRVIGDFGMPMGPFQMFDLVGLDLGWRARKLAKKPLSERPLTTLVPDKLCELERFGQKNGKGFYLYQESSRAGVADPEVIAIIEQTASELGIQRREFSDEEILRRCLYPLVNEGAHLLEEGIALRPGDIDIVYINGYGFPAYKGGPMFHADEIGLPSVLADLERFHKEIEGFPEPAPLLGKLVAQGRGFRDL